MSYKQSISVNDLNAGGTPSNLNFLRGDNFWGTPSGGATGSLTDGDKGDITVSNSGQTWTIDNSAVTLSKMANLSNNNKIIGRYSAGTGVPQEITLGNGFSLDGASGILNLSGTVSNIQYVSSTSSTSVTATETLVGTVSIIPSWTYSQVLLFAKCDMLKDTGTTTRITNIRVKKNGVTVSVDSTVYSQASASTNYGPGIILCYDAPNTTAQTIYGIYAQNTVTSTTSALRWSLMAVEIGLRGEKGVPGNDGAVGATGPAQGITVNTQSGTTYSLLSSDNGKIIECTSGTTVSITLNNLGVTFGCAVLQSGTGVISITASAGVTIRNRQGYSKSAGQYAVFNILPTGTSGTYIVQGDMA